MTEKFSDPRSLKEATELMVSQMYDSITLEFNPKFAISKQALSSLRTQIENLEERIGPIEKSLMIMIKSPCLIVLYFIG